MQSLGKLDNPLARQLHLWIGTPNPIRITESMPFLPKHLNRYRDIAWLLVKHWRANLLKHPGVAEEFRNEIDSTSRSEEEKAEEFVDDLERLGPTFIKLGQLLSTRRDLLSAAYTKALTRLQDDVEPIARVDVERIIIEELGNRPERAFAEFDERPLATASLGQVHRARLPSGRPVAVKVQRPGVRARVISDLDALEELAELFDNLTTSDHRPGLRRLIALARKSILRELDYRKEAQNQKSLRKNLAEFPRIFIPEPLDDYSTSRVLTMDFVTGTKVTEMDPKALLEDERCELAEELFTAYLHQVLVDGFFHADPHPGNLCLTPDRRIALLDLGLAVRVPPRMQEQLVKLLMAIAEGRGEEAADIATRMGEPDKHFERAEFYDRISHLVTDNQDAPLERVALGQVVMEIQGAAVQTGIQLPEEITMLSKTLWNLEKSLSTLDPTFNLTAATRHYQMKIMRRRSKHIFSFGQVYQSLIETNEFVTLLPERLNKIMELMAENQLRFRMDAIDERQLISGIQKVANRITMGLLLAALVIGASLMMDVETSYTLFGYPAIALFFFLAAATGALILIFRILFYDRTR